jgi:hypothetical protein
MSGYVPDWIFKGATVIYNRKAKRVLDYYFVSSPVHNSDRLILKLHGVKDDVPCGEVQKCHQKRKKISPHHR